MREPRTSIRPFPIHAAHRATHGPSPRLAQFHEPPAATVPGRAEAGQLDVRWARHQDEVRAAQRLRHDVFAGEMGARLSTPLAGHDVDLFDDFCEHLLVRDRASGAVVGTYRVLTPVQARRVGSTYSDTEFDLTRLRDLRDRMVELGRSCVHPAHRQGGVILALWGALADFMHRNRLDVMIGCASIPMRSRGGDGASTIWRELAAAHMAPVRYHVQPRLPLPPARLEGPVPALVRAYLRLGAQVLGPPAWDPDFNTADLPLMLRLRDLPPRYRRHFLDGQEGATRQA
ncbi:GNAT family N-acetyltransferase [Variovorax sp.]|uniref:GNAT family N-acetyltransferase n=1 Tax=Variovorax sp. TaxID=1871043 RepID=UPI002D379FCB|nr:GNAT family N-acyltransferase [Variovorax sp.]HYP85750.1 GNAT family N-acyltransferase [Variovorax sp.]